MLMVGERTNANGSKAFRDAMLAGDWQACVEIARSQARDGSHLLDLCVDYVGRDGAQDMRELAGRFATASTLPIMLDSTEPDVIEAGLEMLGGRCVVNSVNFEDGDGPDSRYARMMPLVQEHGAAVVALTIDEEGQARTAEWKVRVAAPPHRRPHRQVGAAPLRHPRRRADLPDRHRPGGDPPRRHRDDRGDPGDRPALPGRQLHPRHLQRLLRPQPGRPPGAQLGVPARVRAGRPDQRDRARQQDPADGEDPRRAARGRARPGLRPPRARATTRCRSSSSCSRASTSPARGRPGPQELAALPLDERLKRRIIDGERNGLEADLDEALAVAVGAVDHQRHPARRHEGRRRAVRLRPDAAAVRAPVRRGHEDRGGLPRAAHGEDRRRRQGPHRARHRQGRRARHRQEPGRHHPVQQRLRGRQHRHQAADQRDPRRRRGAQGRRDRHVRAAGQDHGHHEGEPAGDDHPRRRRAVAGPARRRRADPRLRRGRPAGAVRRRGALRPRRLRGPVPHGQGDDRQAGRRRRSSTRRARQALAAAPGAAGAAALGRRGRPAGAGRRLGALRRRLRRATCPTPPFFGTRVVKGIPLADYASLLDERATFLGPVGSARRPRRQRPVLRGAGRDRGPAAAAVLAGPARRRQGARSGRGLRLLPGVLRGQRPGRARRERPLRARPVHLPAPAPASGACAWPTSSRRAAPTQLDVVALQLVTVGQPVSEYAAKLFAAQRLPRLPRGARPLRAADRGAGRVLAPADPRRAGPARRATRCPRTTRPTWRACCAPTTGAAATRSATRPAPTWRTGRRSSTCSTPDRIGVAAVARSSSCAPEQATDAIVVHHPEANYFNAK